MCMGNCRDRINTAITSLELGYNRIGDAGAAALADALRCACISGKRGLMVSPDVDLLDSWLHNQASVVDLHSIVQLGTLMIDMCSGYTPAVQ